MRTIRALVRQIRLAMEPLLRAKVLAGLGFIGALTVAMLLLAGNLVQYWQNLGINLGAELVGTIVIYVALTPILRSTEGRIQQHARLNYRWFTDRVRYAEQRVQVLDTFSGLFAGDRGQRFVNAATEVLRRGGLVQILLLSPDSAAADQRTAELHGRTDVGMEAMRNLADLARYASRLPEELRSRFQVRAYAAAAGITIYRWDDRLLVSFLTLGRLSGDKEQLEVEANASLGDFVSERFDELWSDSVPLAEVIRRRVAIRDPHGRPEFAVRFIDVDERMFVSDARVAEMCLVPGGHSVHAWLIDTPEQGYHAHAVADESLSQRLADVHHEKYGNTGTDFVELRPHVPQQRQG